MIVRFVVIFACVLLLTGLFWPYLTKLGLGRLPCDLVVERKRFNIHVPLISMLISTAATFVLSAALWLGSQR